MFRKIMVPALVALCVFCASCNNIFQMVASGSSGFNSMAVGEKNTVVFDINGGAGTAPQQQTVDPGSDITLPDAAGFTLDGFHFVSWNTAADGSGTSYNIGDIYTVDANVTLYAQWVAD